ncbi:hypothetical protein C8R44DRAFT_880999 [Mycena epipterygia]|nr:hypothetical protein C8R44DRAFT_880999 [Mycena epipterygia]
MLNGHLAALATADRARAHYEFASSGMPAAQQKLSRRDLSLMDEADAVYLVNIEIRTAPQTVVVMVDTGFYEFPCAMRVNITVSFGSKAWPLDLANINIGPTSDNACLGAIFAISDTVNPSGANWEFGLTFLAYMLIYLLRVPSDPNSDFFWSFQRPVSDILVFRVFYTNIGWELQRREEIAH